MAYFLMLLFKIRVVKNKFFGISEINVLYVLNHLKNKLQYNLLMCKRLFCLFGLFSNNNLFYLYTRLKNTRRACSSKNSKERSWFKSVGNRAFRSW